MTRLILILALVLAQEESGAYYSLQQDQDVAQEMCWALHRMILSKPSLRRPLSQDPTIRLGRVSCRSSSLWDTRATIIRTQ